MNLYDKIFHKMINLIEQDAQRVMLRGLALSSKWVNAMYDLEKAK